ncbi:MAG: hypothetical protein ACTSUD_11440, partial [Alphaproteobacteria bacterium]
MKHRGTIYGAGALALVILAQPVLAEQVRPFDEGAGDRSFASFRKKLIAALERRDMKFVVARAAPGIRLGFGGQDGRKWFRRYLVGSRALYGKRIKAGAAEYRGWLRWVLMNGGGFAGPGKSFYAPYQNAYEVRVPDCRKKPVPKTRVCQLDPFSRAYILGRGISLYARPSAQSK